MRSTSTGYRVVSIVFKLAVFCIALIVALGSLPDTWMMPMVIVGGVLIFADLLMHLNRTRLPRESGKGPGGSYPAS